MPRRPYFELVRTVVDGPRAELTVSIHTSDSDDLAAHHLKDTNSSAGERFCEGIFNRTCYATASRQLGTGEWDAIVNHVEGKSDLNLGPTFRTRSHSFFQGDSA